MSVVESRTTPNPQHNAPKERKDKTDNSSGHVPVNANCHNTPPCAGIKMRTYIIDRKQGDLTLRIGQRDRTEFFVNSRALIRASPVFRCMLDGPFLERRPSDRNEPWVIYLPEDDPRPARTLFELVHLHTGTLLVFTETPHIADLYEMLIFSDKYDMIRALQPWANVWASRMTVDISDPIHILYLMGVQREFGALDSLVRLANSMLLYCGTDEDGNLSVKGGAIDPLGKRRNMHLVPMDVLDNITAARQSILKTYFTRIRDFIEKLKSPLVLEGQEGCTKYPQDEQNACNRRVLDLVVAALGTEEMECIQTDPGDPVPYQKSLYHLTEPLHQIDLGLRFALEHRKCPSRSTWVAGLIVKGVERIKAYEERPEDMWNLVSQENREYMLRQREKLGEVEFDSEMFERGKWETICEGGLNGPML
ncbi:hypothetical protein V8F20_008203 [Naviculisporaceae sp. PSN 640]